MGRKPCCEKAGLKKGTWTSEEDRKLIDFIINYGKCCWRDLPKLAGLSRCGKSCRLRWTNYLRPDLKRGLLSEWEESTVIRLHAQLGNKWSKIASQLPGRTDNEIKNHWNTHIKKKLKTLGGKPDIPTMAIQQPTNDIQCESTAPSSSSMDDDMQSAIAQLAKHLDVPDYGDVTDCDIEGDDDHKSNFWRTEDDDDDEQLMRLWVDDIKDCLDMFG